MLALLLGAGDSTSDSSLILLRLLLLNKLALRIMPEPKLRTLARLSSGAWGAGDPGGLRMGPVAALAGELGRSIPSESRLSSHLILGDQPSRMATQIAVTAMIS